MNVNKIFDLLDDWRKLPGYQLERRADIFFGLHLELIMEKILGVRIDMIIPEFPIRKDSLSHHAKFNAKPLKRPNQSFQIDYLCYSKNPYPRVYFVELKTEVNSRNEKQDWYLENAQKIKLNGILEGFKRIYYATNKKGKVKYNHLLDKIVDVKWINMNSKSFDILDINIEPVIIYIQPTSKKIDDTIITFDKIIEKLKDINDPLTIRFLESLEKWK